ncbi:MAG: HAMP domain-containing protein [Spirochaetaceae bacterium]
MTKNSLKSRLRGAFLLITILSISLTILFSLVYFYIAVRNETIKTMETKINIAQELIYEGKKENVDSFTRTLSSNNLLKVTVDLDIRNKINEYLIDVINTEKKYHITVFDSDFNKMAVVGLGGSVLAENPEISQLKLNPFAVAALKGDSLTSTEMLFTSTGQRLLSITSAYPVERNGVAGGILVRYILNDNYEIVDKIKEELEVDAQIFIGSNSISSTTESVNSDLILTGLTRIENFEDYDNFAISKLWFGKQFGQFVALSNPNGQSIGVLGISISSDKYMKTFLNALFFYFLILIALFGFGLLFIISISNSIIHPINGLLDGVNKITEGDLSHEIKISFMEEIGRLSKAFNEMRETLKEKIGTIQDMNSSLEGTIKKRTETIETLLNTMRRYLPSQLYNAMSDKEFNGDTRFHYRKKLTVFFSDIVSFTSTTEKLEPEDLSELLNQYLDNMSKIAAKWGGTIDKFIGDAIMVFFGDPEFTNDRDHALRAVRMSMEMIVCMDELRDVWKNLGVEKPLHIRMGINTGYCTVGNFGSEDRMDYTIIGGNVNLASRFETAAAPDTILISHETYALIKDEINCEKISELTLKGFDQAIKAYRVLGEKTQKTKMKLLSINENGLKIKNFNFNQKELEQDDRVELIRNLNLALNYAKGEISSVYDENNDVWKFVRNTK